ncbi:ParA family protein [Cetobacterium sp. ZWU0022]|uniref:ParA family protein n=1 Tax=Cetobacterium sp. ZWU0022 TaxID=1340502 RepID=UPI0006479264|nr:AAA family ATPase [Cetobacterium sp. ZWU0022]
MSVILIKNNKGGVGKSWITLQLAHGLQHVTNKKVLIITSDNQNNILEYAGKEKIVSDSGLEKWIRTGAGDLVRLREKLFFIPLKTSHLNLQSKGKLKELFEVFKQEYAYILIDSTPVVGIDKYFVELADKVVVPGFADKVTINSITSLLEGVEIRKVKSVIINKWTKTAKEKEYYNGLKEVLEPFEIHLTAPISQSATIGKLIDDGKTIWESNSKKIKTIQESFVTVIEEIL